MSVFREDTRPSVADLLDSQLETSDHEQCGRVADIELEFQEDGTLVLTALLVGPQALAGRISSRLRDVSARIFHNRFEYRIPLDEVTTIGPTVHLLHPASAYLLGRSEDWIARHILRWIPGSGY